MTQYRQLAVELQAAETKFRDLDASADLNLCARPLFSTRTKPRHSTIHTTQHARTWCCGDSAWHRMQSHCDGWRVAQLCTGPPNAPTLVQVAATTAGTESLMNKSGRFGAFSRALVGTAIIGHTHTCSFWRALVSGSRWKYIPASQLFSDYTYMRTGLCSKSWNWPTGSGAPFTRVPPSNLPSEAGLRQSCCATISRWNSRFDVAWSEFAINFSCVSLARCFIACFMAGSFLFVAVLHIVFVLLYWLSTADVTVTEDATIADQSSSARCWNKIWTNLPLCVHAQKHGWYWPYWGGCAQDGDEIVTTLALDDFLKWYKVGFIFGQFSCLFASTLRIPSGTWKCVYVQNNMYLIVYAHWFWQCVYRLRQRVAHEKQIN